MTVAERVPPHNKEAEQALLGCLMLDKTKLDEVVEKVQADDFYSSHNALIFETMVEMRQRNLHIDTLTLRDALKSKRVGKGASEQSAMSLIPDGDIYVLSLVDSVPSSSQWERYADIIRRCSIYRRLIVVGTEAAATGYESPEDVEQTLANVQSEVLGLTMATTTSTLPVSTVISDLHAQIRKGAIPHTKFPGLPTVRMHPGDLIVIGGGTSAGKTAFALNHVIDQLSRKVPCTYFEYEMTESDLIARLVCQYAGITYAQIEEGNLSDEEMARVEDAMTDIYNRKLNLQEVWCDAQTLFAKIRREAMAGVQVVVIDHLSLIPFSVPKNRRLNDAKAIGVCVTNPLKRLASELGITIILLSQQNRDGQDPAHFPKLKHLRDSGEIEQDASHVLMLWSDKGLKDDHATRAQKRDESGILSEDEIGSNDFNLVRVGIEKNRNGALGHKYFVFHGAHFRFEDRSEEVAVVSASTIQEELL